MRLRMQRPAAVGIDHAPAQAGLVIHLLDIRGHVEEALGAQEELGARLAKAPGNAQMRVQLGVRRMRAEVEVSRPRR